MEEYRIIEITDGCMGGASSIYLTDISDEEITAAIREYNATGSYAAFDDLEESGCFSILVCSEEYIDYNSGIRDLFNISKVFDICQIELESEQE